MNFFWDFVPVCLSTFRVSNCPSVSKGLRSSVRNDLLRLFHARGLAILARRAPIPFASWDAKGTTVGLAMPDDFVFPGVEWNVDAEDWRSICNHSIRSLRARNVRADAFMDFLSENVPPVAGVVVDDDPPVAPVLRRPKRPRVQPEPEEPSRVKIVFCQNLQNKVTCE